MLAVLAYVVSLEHNVFAYFVQGEEAEGTDTSKAISFFWKRAEWILQYLKSDLILEGIPFHH